MSKSVEKHLHIISFDIPVPANYGGAIDVFYKIKALKERNIHIHLHCFKYGGRKPSEMLKKKCDSVHYYTRKSFAHDLTGNVPYIVNSRRDEELIERLLSDDYPILFEGLHSCYYLNDERLKDRLKIVRTHNIEHDYYLNLSKTEKNYFRKLYYINEAKALKDYETILEHATGIAVISQNDHVYFSQFFKKVFTVSAFHPNEQVEILPGKGKYALYHGSLEVNENHHAALFLVNNVFSGLKYKLIIAGNKPKRELVTAVENTPNIEIRTGLGVEQIHKLVREAHVNILPTFQATGIKLKLLLALYNGRHCLVNTPMVINTGLESLCHIADEPQLMRSALKNLFNKDMTTEEIGKRKNILEHNGFMNSHNADLLIKKIFQQ